MTANLEWRECRWNSWLSKLQPIDINTAMKAKVQHLGASWSEIRPVGFVWGLWWLLCFPATTCYIWDGQWNNHLISIWICDYFAVLWLSSLHGRITLHGHWSVVSAMTTIRWQWIWLFGKNRNWYVVGRPLRASFFITIRMPCNIQLEVN